MEFKIYIYGNEPLIVDELIKEIDTVLPQCDIVLWSDNKNINNDYMSKSFDLLSSDSDVLILLSVPSESDIGVCKKFNGDIIDFTFSINNEDVYKVNESIEHLFKTLLKNCNYDGAVVYLPAVIFGKNGVDDLINYTRSIFSFENYDANIFDINPAFNIIFGKDKQGNVLQNYVSSLRKSVGDNIEVRIIPVSTGFLIDIYGSSLSLDDDMFDNEFDTLLDVVENSSLVISRRNSGVITVAGDYIKITIGQIIAHIKNIIGV